jgi:FAD binding domain in molybdopterin dehydrogenase
MRPFAYHRPADSKALEAIPVGPPQDVPPTSARAQFIAGGTTILDLTKLDVAQPEILIDINPVRRFERNRGAPSRSTARGARPNGRCGSPSSCHGPISGDRAEPQPRRQRTNT